MSNLPYLPSPPFLPISSIINFRDIGGYSITIDTRNNTSNGTEPNGTTPPKPKSIRTGLIYRSGAPTRPPTATDLSLLSTHSITTLFDLRSNPELLKHGDTILHLPGTTRYWTPAFPDTDYSPERIAKRFADYASESEEGFVRAYEEVAEAAAGSYARILRWVIAHYPPEEKEEGEKGHGKRREACVVHCTAGKDRTGVFVGLVLSLCGVDDEVVAEEYALTELGLREMVPVFVGRLMREEALGGSREKCERMIGASKNSMLGTLKMIREKYGSAEGYFRSACGLSDDEIRRIRDILTCDEPPISIKASL